ncbi:MAG: ATP-binding protein [Nitrospinota bacterium]|nr:ATP-binding protein [Nitrospinota bacterium]
MDAGDIENLTFHTPAPTYNRILLAARLAIISFLMGTVVYYQSKFGQLGDYIPALAPVAATYLLTILYAIYLGWGTGQRRFAYFQLFVDQFLITWIVYSTGGLNSPFTFLYVLVIVASVFFGPARAGYALAALAASLFIGLTVAENHGYIHPYHPFPPLADPKVFYNVVMSVMVNTLSFFFVAVMSSHLTGLLSKTGQELAQTIEDFTMLKAFHENVLRNMGLGFMAVGLDRSVLSINPAAERILRASASDVIRKPVEKVLGLEAIREFFGGIEGAGEGERRYHWIYKASGGDDVYLTMALNKFVVGNKIHGAIAVFQDVTELKQMERSMADSERLAAIGKVAAIIAHEIRNPLASLSGSIQVLSSDLSSNLDEASARLMKITVREADRLNHIITDFLDYSSTLNLSRQHIKVAELFEEIITLLKSSPKLSPSVKIHVQVDQDLTGFMDQERIKQVLWNIILNALEAMSAQGILTLKGSRQKEHPSKPKWPSWNRGDAGVEDWIIITVEDNGQGMDEDILENIFEPFFTTKPGGTGLGLPSARKIMESHGGGISASSTPGEGSTFTLWLPGKTSVIQNPSGNYWSMGIQ